MACLGEAQGAAGAAIGISMQHGSSHRGLYSAVSYDRLMFMVPALIFILPLHHGYGAGVRVAEGLEAGTAQ